MTVKDVRTKSRKIDPLVRADTTINFEKSDVFAPKSADVHIWRPPDFGRLIWTAPHCEL